VASATAVRPRARRRAVRARRPIAGVPWLFVVPALVVYGAFFLIPNLAGVGYAFTDWDGLSKPAYVGTDNFSAIFGNPDGKGALIHTLVIAGTYVVVVNLVGLGLALGLHRALKSRNLLRALFFAPAAVSPLAVAYVWKYILAPDGALNSGLDSVGLGSLAEPWLAHGDTALWAIVGVMVWQFSGYHMVIYLAGLQNIGEELYEAAAIDGAPAWRRFLDITRPQLLPAFTVSIALSLIGSLKVFDQVIALTDGGPGTSTETLASQVYKQAFVNGRFGYSAALALLLAIAVAVLAFVQMRTMRPKAA
jgi:raffinose/stachyose/melibiose transport system permease protein